MTVPNTTTTTTNGSNTSAMSSFTIKSSRARMLKGGLADQRPVSPKNLRMCSHGT